MEYPVFTDLIHELRPNLPTDHIVYGVVQVPEAPNVEFLVGKPVGTEYEDKSLVLLSREWFKQWLIDNTDAVIPS